MKISVGELRSLITEAIGIPDGAALYTKLNEEVAQFVLWDPKKLDKLFEKLKKEEPNRDLFELMELIQYHHCEEFLYGSIILHRLESPAWNKSGRGWEVSLVVAQKGYGPTIYNIAIGELGSIIPDREQVSADARNVWVGFRDKKSPGVTLKPLDDESNPKTPPKIDDAPIPVDMPNNDWYNFAAVGNGLKSKRYQTKSSSEMKSLANKYNLKMHELEMVLETAADDLFSKYYKG